jgi:predicted  nucleic acid-binding Zn-ribbon protein
MQESMQDKIRKLSELQGIDTKINAIEKSRGNLPYIVEELKAEISLIENEVSELEKTNNELAESLRDSKSTIEKSKILLEKYKNQRNMVTNNKEYEALIKEIDFRETLVIEEEDRIKELAEDLTVGKENFETKTRILSSRKSTLTEKETELEQKLNDTQEEEKNLKEKRNLLVAKIEKPLYNLYLRVYGSKGRLAVVPANEGHCGGCFTVLPSQKLSELRRADSIVQCDACSRILYYET